MKPPAWDQALNYSSPKYLGRLAIIVFRVGAGDSVKARHKKCHRDLSHGGIRVDMEGQNQNDELYPIAVLIDELKVLQLRI